MKEKVYGYELIIDLNGCDSVKFNRTSLRNYFSKICESIGMKRDKLYFWDDSGLPEKEKQTLPHTKGTSAVQFILTSSIVIHTLDLLQSVYVNIFSCKEFDSNVVKEITKDWFGARKCKSTFLVRT